MQQQVKGKSLTSSELDAFYRYMEECVLPLVRAGHIMPDLTKEYWIVVWRRTKLFRTHAA